MDRVLLEWSTRIREERRDRIGDAMAYSLSGPGKRLRPALVVAVFRALEASGDPTELATAVEVVHTYSLVHDDLPCMDDDDLRRGRPTTHKQFDVATATEAAFRLVPLSARILAAGARTLGLGEPALGVMGRELYTAAGVTGMIGGQVLDLEAEGRGISQGELERIHRRKTGALISASAVIGALAARASSAQQEAAREYGREIGLAFQIIDDVLDATGTTRELGKTSGKDAQQRKASFANLVGVEGAHRGARAHAQQAVDRLTAAGIDSDLLTGLAHFIIARRS